MIFDKLWNKRIHFKSLKQKTLAFYVILFGFFAILFVASFMIVLRRTNVDYRAKASEKAVDNVASMVNSTVQNYNYISRLIMVNDRVVSFLKCEEADKSMSYEARMGMYEILNHYGNINYIESVYIFRNDGEYANTGKNEYIIDMESDGWQYILEADGAKTLSINGNGVIIKKDGKPTLTFARAINDINSQELLGILVMNISSSCFDEVISIQKASGMCVVDTNGTYLCGDEELANLYKDEYNSENTVSKNIRFRGKRAAFTAKNAIPPLIVMCCTNTSATPLPIETLFAMLMTFCALFLSSIIHTLFVQKNITKPIMTLDASIERTKAEGWLARIEEEMPDDEIGRLAESYNNMIDYMNELFEQLLREEENIRKAEMMVLYEQIKPHFLYNTLETIRYLAIQEDAVQVRDALETLGSFYRNFLSKGKREIPFRDELRIIQDYLALQKLRYGDSFTDEYEIDEGTLDYMVPKLILQPLVENSIYHGVKLKGEHCIIKVTARLSEGGLHVSIYDTGVGMSEEQIQKVLETKREEAVRKSPGGFGLAGTIDRIRYYCNKDDVVTIRSEMGEYTEIEICIPQNTQERLRDGEE
ncbi:MAG: sensor histidine kinase [Lachnospiraceae bacterium]|nr:sensor histidine kinase [Lachnospiraceae bacterium]